jgi:hypothetical protein
MEKTKIRKVFTRIEWLLELKNIFEDSREPAMEISDLVDALINRKENFTIDQSEISFDQVIQYLQ